ncbi:hypothetical protein [Clostridium perfringens]|uniref:hypothetical protein n=3 Tax=Clostridium perfringens TaxID=1502 RepID=UPI0018E48F12|nr:hypothetical protein [Clostridium perfringens]MBI5994908.1 hypothetical protein [Clostridium perfringens]MDM0700753.1 hypothetical protein [Clostridium perfringens]
MLAIKQYVEETPIVSEEFIRFNIEDIEEYKKLFNSYKGRGVINEETEFDNNTWSVNNATYNFSIQFNFSEVVYKKMQATKGSMQSFEDFIVSLKAFTLYSFSEVGTRRMKEYLSQFKKLFHHTIFLSQDIVDDGFFTKNATLWRAIYPLSLYLNFNEDFLYNDELLENINEYYNFKLNEYIREEYERQHGISRTAKVRRLLPLYSTMFKFDDIINDFIQTSYGDEREMYFPIILWWKITTIIPLRATEFSITPLNCIGARDSKGRNVITLYRTVAKGARTMALHTFDEKYKKYEFPVTEEIVGLINEYKDMVKNYDIEEDFYGNGCAGAIERKQLLSMRSHFKFIDIGSFSVLDRSKNIDTFTTNQFNSLIKRFMKDIVWGKYKIQVTSKKRLYVDFEDDLETNFSNSMQTINMMDTRHFAIMNLVHLGYSPSTIQRIVGHDKISSSFAYSDHQEVFTDCYVMSIAKKKAFDKNSEFKNIILDMSFESVFGEYESNGHRRYNMLKYKNTSPENKIKATLDEGYCVYDKDDMLPCKLLLGNHRRCKFFVPFKNKLSIIREEIESLSNELSSEIRTMQYIIKHHKKIKDFENKYMACVNKMKSLELQKGEMIADYIINGVEKEDDLCLS